MILILRFNPDLGKNTMMGKKVFVVEDDLFFSKMVQHKLSMDPEFEVQVFQNGKEFLNQMSQFPSVVTLDYMMPDFFRTGAIEKNQRKESQYSMYYIIWPG